MYFKQFYLACLAHASYLIGSEGEAAVVDPQRDVDEYLAEADARGLKVKYVIETHLHADFVSGHQEIAARTGAQIMERSSDVTREVVLIIQAIIILLVTAERLLPVLLPFIQARRLRRAAEVTNVD